MSTAPSSPSEIEALALKRCKSALRLVCASLPHLSGLARQVRLRATSRVSVAAVSPSGLVMVNSTRFAETPLADAAYIMAHELLHLALDTAGRRGDSDPLTVNIAHDFIINDMLSDELNQHPPLGGLSRYGARYDSLEKLVAELSAGQAEDNPGRCWSPEDSSERSTARNPRPSPPSPLSRALRDAGLVPPDPEPEPEPEPSPTPADGLPADDPLNLGDLIPEDREAEFEPELSQERREQLRERVRREAAKAASLGELGAQMDAAADLATAANGEPQRGEALISAVRGAYQSPWELALQHWMDAVSPGDRTYARPSRRGADRGDCVLPGRQRNGWTLHVVLDTSGSMSEVLPRALGAIAVFCETAGVSDVHILQCDAAVTHDDWVEPESLAHYPIAGFGGSDMSPGLLRLADDPEVTAALVLTDGYIDYPANPLPFQVLWAIIDGSVQNFNPPYGTVLEVRV